MERPGKKAAVDFTVLQKEKKKNECVFNGFLVSGQAHVSQGQPLTAFQTALVSKMDPRLLFLATGGDGSSVTVGATGCERSCFSRLYDGPGKHRQHPPVCETSSPTCRGSQAACRLHNDLPSGRWMAGRYQEGCWDQTAMSSQCVCV